MAELILGYWGVVVMVALWNAAVGFVWLAFWRDKSLDLVWPALFVAIALLLIGAASGAAEGAFVALPLFFGSSILMGPAARLAWASPTRNFILGASCLSLAVLSFIIGRSESHPAALPFLQAVIELVLTPLAILFLGSAASRGRKLFAPWAASGCFLMAWLVWMSRDYFHTAT